MQRQSIYTPSVEPPDRRPVVLISGEVKGGKSTLANSLVGFPFYMSEILECTPRVTALVIDPTRVGLFSVLCTDGTQCDFPIQALADYHPSIDDQKLILYCDACSLLKDISILDIPGTSSTLEFTHNKKAEAFLSKPENFDVLVQVVSPGNPFKPDLNEVLPPPRVLVINRIDDEIIWGEKASSPASVIQARVSKTHASLNLCMTKSELMPTVVGCSAIVGLASVVWNEEILQSVLDLAKTGEMSLLSAKTYFNTEVKGVSSVKVRRVLADSASRLLRSRYDAPSNQPSFAAIRFALGISIRESISSYEILRDRMRETSGVDQVREAVLAVARSPLVAMRRELIADVKGCQTQADETERALKQTRLLLQSAKRLKEKHTSAGTLGLTEDRKFLTDVREYLAKNADVLAKQSHENRQKFERAEAEYIRLGTDLACKRLVESSDYFSDDEKRVLMALFGSHG